ncbi:Ig-like domain-containing protein [Enterobacteriaceae bacterium LUAb1]
MKLSTDDGTTLSWLQSANQASTDDPLNKTLKLDDGGLQLPGINVTCVINSDSDQVIFKALKDNDGDKHHWTGPTDEFGRVHVSVISLDSKARQFTLDAYVTDEPTITAPNLPLTFTSLVKSITLSPHNTPATGSIPATVNSPITFTATVIGADDKPRANEQVTFSALHGATFEPSGGQTNSQGQISTNMTRTRSGSDRITATAGDQSDFADVDFEFMVQSVQLTPAESHIAVTEKVTLTATLIGTDGNPRPNMMVAFTPAANCTPSSGISNAQGQVTTTVANTHRDNLTVTATASGHSKTAVVDFEFPVDAVALAPKDGVFAVGSNVTYTVTVTDASHNPRPNAQVIFEPVNSPGATCFPSSGFTNAQGQATTTVSTTHSGNVTVKATAYPYTKEASSYSKNTSTTVDFEFPVDAVALVPKDGVFPMGSNVTYTATVTDPSHNPRPNAQVIFEPINSPGATCFPSSGFTNARGEATTTVSTTHSGNVTVKATAYPYTKEASSYSKNNSTTVDFEFPVDAVALEPKDGVFAVGSNVTYTATVTDASHNPRPNAQVIFEPVNSPGATCVPSSGFTNAQGQATTTVSTTNSGNVTVKATAYPYTKEASSYSKNTSTSVDFEFPIKSVTLVPQKSYVLVSGSMPLIATITDTHDKPRPNTKVTFSSTSNNVTLDPPGGTTDAHGQVATNATGFYPPGSITVTASALPYSNSSNADKKSASTSIDFEFPIHSISLSPQNKTVLTGSNNGDTITATVLGTDYEPRPNAKVTFSTNDGGQTLLNPATQYTNSAGQAWTRVTRQQSGVVTISATASSDPQAFSPDNKSTNTSMDFEFPVKQMVIAPQYVAIDDIRKSVDITVTITGSDNKPRPNAQVTFSASNGASLTTTSALTDPSGKVTTRVTGTHPGVSVITAQTKDLVVLTEYQHNAQAVISFTPPYGYGRPGTWLDNVPVKKGDIFQVNKNDAANNRQHDYRIGDYYLALKDFTLNNRDASASSTWYPKEKTNNSCWEWKSTSDAPPAHTYPNPGNWQHGTLVQKGDIFRVNQNDVNNNSGHILGDYFLALSNFVLSVSDGTTFYPGRGAFSNTWAYVEYPIYTYACPGTWQKDVVVKKGDIFQVNQDDVSGSSSYRLHDYYRAKQIFTLSNFSYYPPSGQSNYYWEYAPQS